MNHLSPNAAFVNVTNKLLTHGKLHGEYISFPFAKCNSEEDEKLAKIFDEVFKGKTAYKGGVELPWRQWLLASGFPWQIYKEHGEDLIKTINDVRLKDTYLHHRTRSSYHNFFSRLCDKGYIQYLLERWSNPKHSKAMPHYFFDIESPTWVWEELMKNKNQVKTGRSAMSCCMNAFFRWDTEANLPIIGWILKHVNWSHFYQDIYSPILWGRAICKELGLSQEGYVNLFCVSMSVDCGKQTRQILKGAKNAYSD